ncbi:TIGR02301 family protein [Rhizobium sp. 2MFCol3.1]|uniref:TIGR02301 family protein n=1 Tax=Rhizobium sp. 2MFCol3.1 TaxID=1246459 RepID=UPI0003998E1A|nr:TIGR02301 family protein [Rhizobium sp. 2MFCol3.1]
MIPLRCVLLCVVLGVSTAIPTFVSAQGPTAVAPDEPVAPKDVTVPYDDKLGRLAEVLGSVHYLRTLCKAQNGEEWRARMQQLLDSEAKDEPSRKEKLTAAFNRGYRAFASVYTDCTPAAIMAEERYRNEGATLATEITSRFGN